MVRHDIAREAVKFAPWCPKLNQNEAPKVVKYKVKRSAAQQRIEDDESSPADKTEAKEPEEIQSESKLSAQWIVPHSLAGKVHFAVGGDPQVVRCSRRQTAKKSRFNGFFTGLDVAKLLLYGRSFCPECWRKVGTNDRHLIKKELDPEEQRMLLPKA